MVQDRAYKSFSASEAMVAFLYIPQAKSHSTTPPSAIALQYTVVLKLGLILDGLNKTGKKVITITAQNRIIHVRSELKCLGNVYLIKVKVW